jgi:hypothetical protein
MSIPPSACSLSDTELARAREGYRQAAAHYGAIARFEGAAARIELRGDKPSIVALLDDMIARESGCCSHLRFEVAETTQGYGVVLSVNDLPALERPALLDALSILFPTATITAPDHGVIP